MIVRTPEEIAEGKAPRGLVLDDDGTPRGVLTLVDLSRPADTDVLRAAAARFAAVPTTVAIGVAAGADAPPNGLADMLTCTITNRPARARQLVPVSDVDAALERLTASVAARPRASLALAALLRQTAGLGTREGLAAESAVYSMLLDGPEFRQWCATRPPRTPPDDADPVVLDRDGTTLTITLDRPARHNAFGTAMREALVDAFDVALADPTVTRVEVRGRGPSFCSGGDLDEFGTAPEGSTAHLIRLDRSVGARIDRCRDRVTSYLHGACIGAGIELPAFGHDVVAAPDTAIRLPEIELGLIPGAGGTVSLTRRIGRWRTAYLALTGATLPAETALDWGLVDRIEP